MIFEDKGGARVLFNYQDHVKARFNSLGSAIYASALILDAQS